MCIRCALLTTSGPAAATCDWDQDMLMAIAGGVGLAAALTLSWKVKKISRHKQVLQDLSIVKEIQVDLLPEIIDGYDPGAELKLRDASAVRLQRWARRVAAEALLREMGLLEGRKTAASLFLQSSFRTTADRRRTLELKKKKNDAATRIQRKFRRFIALRFTAELGSAGTGATLFLTSFFTNVANEETQAQLENRAALKIQNAWWMYYASKLTREAIMFGDFTDADDDARQAMQKGAAVMMQTLFRGQAARRNAERLRRLKKEREEKAARTIQGLYIIWSAKCRVSKLRRERHAKAATTIQSWYRMLEYRKWFLAKKKVWHLDMVRDDLLACEPQFVQHHRDVSRPGSAKAALIGKMADVDALAADLEHAIAAPAAEAYPTAAARDTYADAMAELMRGMEAAIGAPGAGAASSGEDLWRQLKFAQGPATIPAPPVLGPPIAARPKVRALPPMQERPRSRVRAAVPPPPPTELPPGDAAASPPEERPRSRPRSRSERKKVNLRRTDLPPDD